MKTILYPGSFDPVTNGHLDLIRRAARLFDRVIITAAVNVSKTPFFSMEERLDLLKKVCAGIPNVEVTSYSGLLADALNRFQADAVLRGIRSVSDFEYEYPMAQANRELNPAFETVFLMPGPENSFVSSRMIREIASFGGSVTAFVPPEVAEAIQNKIKG